MKYISSTGGKPVNAVHINGRLVKDPELKTFESNTRLCTFCIANDVWFGGNKKTGFYWCNAWGKPGMIIADNAKKGTELFVTGRLEQNRWDDEKGVTHYDVAIVVEQFDFGKNSSSAETHQG